MKNKAFSSVNGLGISNNHFFIVSQKSRNERCNEVDGD